MDRDRELFEEPPFQVQNGPTEPDTALKSSRPWRCLDLAQWRAGDSTQPQSNSNRDKALRSPLRYWHQAAWGRSAKLLGPRPSPWERFRAMGPGHESQKRSKRLPVQHWLRRTKGQPRLLSRSTRLPCETPPQSGDSSCTCLQGKGHRLLDGRLNSNRKLGPRVAAQA